MSETTTTEKVKGKKKRTATPAAVKPPVKPRKKHARSRPAIERISEHYPPGFGATVRKQKVTRAFAVLAKKYPKMSESEARAYLVEVGAGRLLALANYKPEE